MSQLIGMDDPFGGVSGPLPAAPSVLNLTVSVGSTGSPGLVRVGDEPAGAITTRPSSRS